MSPRAPRMLVLGCLSYGHTRLVCRQPFCVDKLPFTRTNADLFILTKKKKKNYSLLIFSRATCWTGQTRLSHGTSRTMLISCMSSGDNARYYKGIIACPSRGDLGSTNILSERTGQQNAADQSADHQVRTMAIFNSVSTLFTNSRPYEST
jgi:hypothetical protein